MSGKTTKHCSRCKTTKALAKFHRQNRLCKPCRKKYVAARWRTARGRALKLLQNAKYRARKRGCEFSLSVCWLVDKLKSGRCEMTNQLFDYAPADTYTNPWAPSLDRRDNTGGYTPDNVQVIASCVNRAKGNLKPEDFRRMVEAIMAGHGW